MRWWQKKLPLKNQPSNPLAQLLRPGLDESSRYLTEARVELLDPARRQKVDSELAAQANEQAVIEFHKYLTFAIANGTLTAEEEKSLHKFGAEHGLTGGADRCLHRCGIERQRRAARGRECGAGTAATSFGRSQKGSACAPAEIPRSQGGFSSHAAAERPRQRRHGG